MDMTTGFMEKMQDEAKKRRLRAVQLRSQGLSLPEIGRVLGINRQNAWRLLDEAKKRHETP